MTLYREWLKKIHENDRQKTAFEKAGHTVVIAGPGSGKTRVLALKIAKLLRDEIPQPRGVACLTYTRMMAKELEDRLSSLNVLDRTNVVIGTIHSFCLQQILNPFSEVFSINIPRPIRIAPLPIWNECLSLARENIAGRKFDPDRDKRFKIAFTKYHLENIDIPFEHWENQEFANICQQLQTNLFAKGLVDFDIVIKYSIELLANHDLVRQSLYAKYAWLAVDEYQDLGYPLFRIVDLLIENTPIKLFAIGDPDQSIFDFAGTDPKYLIKLTERHDVQPIIKLDKNYRSVTEIIQAAKAIITPYCEYDSERTGGKLEIYESPLYKQGEIAAWLVNKYLSQHVKAEQIAVLHPWRIEGINVIAQSFDGIRFSLDKNSYYDRNMTIISWLENMAFWCLEGFDFSQKEKNSISFDSLVSTLFQILKPQSNKEIDAKSRLDLARFIWESRGQDKPLYVWLNQISDQILLDANLAQYEQIFPDDVAEYRNLGKITRPGEILESMTLRKFLDMTRGVQLTTIHSSKGMEFEVVIITGIERILNTPNGRRLLYVALTRAQREACLIYSKVLPNRNPSTPVFISDLMEKCGHLPFLKYHPHLLNSIS